MFKNQPKTSEHLVNCEETYLLFLGLLKLSLVVGLLVYNGMVLHRVVACRVLKVDLTERELFYHGFFLSMIINGIIGQYLALFHLFRLSVFIGLFVFNVVCFRKESLFILRYALSIPARFCGFVRKNDVLLCLSWCFFAVVTVLLLLQVQVPSLNVDVWVHQIPIAESIVENHGFVFPVISHPIYGSMPSFANLLFAEGLLVINNYNVANLIHFSIYYSFILLLYSFFAKNRSLSLILLGWILINPLFNNSLTALSVTAMTDTAHACMEAASIIFLLKYRQEKSIYYLVFSAILCGAGLSCKYLGLITLLIYGFIFLLDFKLDKEYLRNIVICLAGILIVCGLWYGKNWILYGNPVYPYFFGHPYISDASMASMNADQGRSFYPEFREYSRNIASPVGWYDFAKATYYIFFNGRVERIFPIMVSVMLLSVVFVKSMYNFFPLLSGIYFALWYFFVFHHGRYGITAFLLFNCAFYFSAINVIDRIFDSMFVTKLRGNIARLISERKTLAARIALNAILILMFFSLVVYSLDIQNTVKRFYRVEKKLVSAYFDRKYFTEYMSDIVPPYRLYTYIADNHLRRVLNPFDNGSDLYMKYVIPGRKPDDVFLHWQQMITSKSDADKFLLKNDIKYFVTLSLSEVALERLGKEHVDMSNFLINKLVPRSELIYTDGNGNQLYKIK